MHAQPTGRQRLTRLSRDPYDDTSRYFHPNGYVITRGHRTWSERVGRMHGQADDPQPLYWWEVWHHISRRRPTLEGRPAAFLTVVSERHSPRSFDTLGDARDWCDQHPREGWALCRWCAAELEASPHGLCTNCGRFQ